MDAEGTGKKKSLGYIGWSEEVRLIAATEGGKSDRTMTNKWALRFLRTLLKRFYMTDTILPPYHFRINLNNLVNLKMEAVCSFVTIRCRNDYFINKCRENVNIFNIQMAIRSFQNVTMFKCFATVLAKYKLYSQGN
jgi:hypothetical protein